MSEEVGTTAQPAPAENPGAVPTQASPGRPLLGQLPLWIAFALVALAIPAAGYLMQKPRAVDLPVLGTLPTFSLTDQHSEPFGSKDVLGRPAVFNFFFTRCPIICPMLTKKMRTLQQQIERDGLQDKVRFVSITADPDNDDPAALLSFAHKHGADLTNWSFVTGRQQDVQKTIVEGFKIHVARIATTDEPRDIEDFEIVHGQKFVLVDSLGQIRGYYDVETPSGLESLRKDLEALAN